MTSSCSTDHTPSLSAVEEDPSRDAVPPPPPSAELNDDDHACKKESPLRGMWNFAFYDLSKVGESRMLLVEHILGSVPPADLAIEPFVLLIGGPLGSGKSRTASTIYQRINEYEYDRPGGCFRVSFATALKIEYSLAQCGDNHAAATGFFSRMEKDLEFKQSHRQGLIDLAAKLRAIDNDYFAKIAVAEIICKLQRLNEEVRALGPIRGGKTRVLAVIDDWRYYNELEVLARTAWFDPEHIMHTMLRCSDDVLRARVPGWTEEMRRIPSETSLFKYSCNGATISRSILRLSRVAIYTIEEKTEDGMRHQQMGVASAAVGYFFGEQGRQFLLRAVPDFGDDSAEKKEMPPTKRVCETHTVLSKAEDVLPWNKVMYTTRSVTPSGLTVLTRHLASGCRTESILTSEESCRKAKVVPTPVDTSASVDAPKEEEPVRHYGGFGCEVDAWGEAYPTEE